ncbi:MAG: hypothetical protein KGD57_10225 [Candidatus Lokiarchaeota archaeon]|nr:hypothetical protein [Candidatus Lokiarchaeota archaeon]
MFIIALDLSNTGCRTFIFDIAGSIIARDYQEWKFHSPRPSYVEQDANEWWNSIKISIDSTIKKSGIDKTEIVSISISNQRETIVPVDKEGDPLYNAILSEDMRATKEADFIKDKIGLDKIYNTTGLTINPSFSATKILWLKNNKPEIYRRTHKFLLVSDFIINKLTGKYVTDFSNVCRTMLFDIKNLRYSEDIANELELDLDKMPEPVESGVDIGEIITDETVLDKKTLVITGAGDQQAAALGVGVIKPGDIKCTTNIRSFLLAYLDEPKFDLEKRVLCSCHAIPGSWVQEAHILTTGSVLRWFRDELGHYERQQVKEEDEEDPYDFMTALAEQSSIGADGLFLIPHLQGSGAPHWNPLSKGIIFGLSLKHKRKDLYRAILEGVAFEIKKNIEIFKNIGINPVQLKLSGGASRSDLWNQITADIVNIICVRNVIEEAAPLGAAILAASGAGIFPDISEAAKTLCKIDKKYIPNEKRNIFYNKLYNFSLNLYNFMNNNHLFKNFSDIFKSKD